MKLLLSILVVFLALTGLISEEIGFNEDLDQWKNSLQLQDEWHSSDPLNEILRRITRKPRPRQFFGLMGKRSYPNAQITRKRQKLNPFVSLMGKRSQEEPDIYEWRLQN